MTTIPEGLSNLRNLTAINLSYCGIEFIDAQDASADQPNTLVAQMARTHDSVFANLTSLTSLSLHGNTLKRLPPSIGRLKSLTFLSVARNKLEVLPASILTLSNLQQLWAWNNNITQYPLSLPIYCPALVDLRMVTQGDQLLSVPGLNKTSLEALRSQENVSSYLRRAPKKDPPSTGGIRTTASAIDSPLYDSCNEMVEPLHFSDVQPPCKGLVTHLKQHLDSTKKMKLYRFKLVILGDGGVGKTTTIKALKHAVAGTSSSTKEEVLLANVASDGLDISMLTTVKALKQAAAASSTSKEDAVLSNVATDGVDISMLTVPLDKKRKDELKNVDALSYSCWDFAGQEQYSYSHTFFLGAHSVYFILFDCSKGDSSQGIERVDYWLQLIRARFPESHCVIVGTHTDKLSKKDLPDFKARVYKRYNMVENSDGTLKYTPPPQSQTSRRGEDYYRVANIHFISNSTKDGINALLDQLRSAYSILYKLRRDLEVPTEWLLLEERIMALGTLTDIPMISWNEWRQDALRWFPSMKEDELKKATQFWHETGTLTWFNEHGLRQYICLRPQFLTKTFSAVITAMIGRPKSILKLAELEMVWKGIPSHYHKYLVQILERFDILHRLDDAFFSVQGDLSRSNTPKSGEVTDSQASKNPHNMPPSLPGYALIPVLLPESKPDQLALDSFWPPIVAAAGPVEYARSYTFDFLPNCIFLRLLVRLLHSKWVALIWWRHGIILRKDYARLYVQHDVSERSIHLKIRVPELRGTEAVQRIGSLLDSIAVLISDWLPNARMITTIPCVFSSGVTRSLQWPDVEAAVMAGHSEISIPGHPTETVRLDHVAPDLALLAHSARVYSASELDLANALELGKGGFGVVLKAALDGKSVAVKKLKSREEDEIMGKPNSDVVFTEFRREAWLMARLVHPHIVGLLGICSPPDMGMVLEFMEGGDLFAYLHGKEDKPPAQLTLDDRFELALGVALGMQFLHSFNPPIIHRDLKSPNVLLTFRSPTGEALQRPIPKIADFGLSRGLVWTPKLSVRSVDCPIWLAPELMNQQPYDDKADVYSFGVILYEIALQHLFLSEHKFDTDKESFIHSGSRPRLPDDLDPTLSALITQCWAQSPEDRPSFDQIVSALQTRTMIAAPSASKLNFGGGWDDFVAAAAART
jgi:serine/threonine-protein kinase CTR1